MDPQSSFRSTRGRDRAPLAVALVLTAAMLTAAVAPAQAAGVKPPPVKLEIEKYTLPNGLEVILREDHRLPLVAVNTWYHVGPANETAGRTGFAHLFEHMMFQSSGHVSEDEIWKDFFRGYYCPNNASLVIVGDIDKAKTKALVEKYYGSIPRGADVPPITATTPPITEERRATVTDKITLPRVYMCWLTSPIFKPGDADAGVAAQILGGGKASRLYKSLVYEKQICQDVSVVQQSYTLGSVFQLTATLKPDKTTAEVEKAIDEELARFPADGPTAQEVAATQNSIYSATVTSLENFGGFSGVADRLNQYNHHLKDPNFLNKDLARFAAVSPASVKKFANDQ